MYENKFVFLDRIKLSNGKTIERYKHYFSGKMEIVEILIGNQK
jgi:hypothetical protein